jgi:hypothetical protein
MFANVRRAMAQTGPLYAITLGAVHLRTLIWFAAWGGGLMIVVRLFH